METGRTDNTTYTYTQGGTSGTNYQQQNYSGVEKGYTSQNDTAKPTIQDAWRHVNAYNEEHNNKDTYPLKNDPHGLMYKDEPHHRYESVQHEVREVKKNEQLPDFVVDVPQVTIHEKLVEMPEPVQTIQREVAHIIEVGRSFVIILFRVEGRSSMTGRI